MADDDTELRLEFIERTLLLLLSGRFRDLKDGKSAYIREQDELERYSISKLLSLINNEEDYRASSGKHLDRISEEISYIKESVNDLRNNLEILVKLQTEDRLRAIETMELLSHSAAMEGERFRRIIPISIYIDKYDPVTGSKIERALLELLEVLGFEKYHAENPIFGSWYKKAWARTKELLSNKDVQERLAKAERALELTGLDTPQAKVDLELSKAVLNLRKALDGQDSGIISSGSLFVIKTTKSKKSQLVVINLTRQQMEMVRDHSSMLCDPEEFLRIFKQNDPWYSTIRTRFDAEIGNPHRREPPALPPPNEDGNG